MEESQAHIQGNCPLVGFDYINANSKTLDLWTLTFKPYETSKHLKTRAMLFMLVKDH